MIRLTISAVLLALLIFNSGCSKSGSVTAPSGSTITFSPSSKSWTAAAGSCTATVYNEETFTITVRDSAGQNMNNADITVELDLSPNTASVPAQVLQLIDGDIGASVTSPYNTKTGDHGTKNMKVRVDIGGCEYTASLKAFSGDAFASASIDVTAQ